MDFAFLKSLLLRHDSGFWNELGRLTQSARDFEELFLLSSLRKKARAKKLAPAGPTTEKLRVAILGGYSL